MLAYLAEIRNATASLIIHYPPVLAGCYAAVLFLVATGIAAGYAIWGRGARLGAEPSATTRTRHAAVRSCTRCRAGRAGAKRRGVR